MKKKHILIVNNNMHIGGVQKALENLLCEIHSDYDVTLLLFYKGGELLKNIPYDVEIIEPAVPFRYLGMSKSDAVGMKDRLFRFLFAVFNRIFGMSATVRLMGLAQKKIRSYDTAISFLHSGRKETFYGGCNEFVLNFVEAKQKITFVHCDFEKIGAKSEKNRKIYSRFDRVAACSEGCRRSFLRCFPEFSHKIVVVKNCQNYKEIIYMSKLQPEEFDRDRFNVLTVARFGKEKGILRAIRAVLKVHSVQKRIKYYIIGEGAENDRAEMLLSGSESADAVTLLGKKENPYGYMAAADLLLVPSFSEAAPMVINESACLGTPILSTETSSAFEMVRDTGLGWVCENSEDGIREGLKKLSASQNEIGHKRDSLLTRRFDNAEAVKQFSELVNYYDEMH